MVFLLGNLSVLLMMFPFALCSHENSQWRRSRCCVGFWTLVQWRKTTCSSTHWPTLSAAFWPLWRTLTQLWLPEPDYYWTQLRGRPCRCGAKICLAHSGNFIVESPVFMIGQNVCIEIVITTSWLIFWRRTPVFA